MDYIENILQRGRKATDKERFDRILYLIEDYGLEIMFSITLMQVFDCPIHQSHMDNIAYTNSLPCEKRLELLELTERAFLRIQTINDEAIH
jgi:hypothetical protein